MADDSFEAARKAFFGTEETTPGRKAFADKVVKPQDEPIVNEEPPTAFDGENETSN